MSSHGIIILTGVLAAAACALPGTFLVLRRMSLIGDAISHAVLPGIVLAVLITGELNSWPVLVGAGAVGLLTVFLIESLRNTRRVKEDAAIAIVFPALFALGVLMVAQFASQKHIDQECVLYGEIAYSRHDTIMMGAFEVARAPLVLGAVALFNLILILVFYKELKVATFDPAHAAAIGLSPVIVHYVLMGSVSLTTVASFESVGAILVVAFLIVPAAAAHLWTDRLPVMLALAVLIGGAGAAGGYWLAADIGASIAGCMAVMMGVLFAFSWLAAPREGVLGRFIRLRRSRTRFANALVLERLEHSPADAATLATTLAWPRAKVDEIVGFLTREELVVVEPGGMRPSPRGAAYVRRVVSD
ncbi:MAG: metal ABC transporter permease [Planctomycetota bacterium]